MSGLSNKRALFNRQETGPKLLLSIAVIIIVITAADTLLPQDSAEQSVGLSMLIGFVVFGAMRFISNKDMQTPEPIGKVRSHAGFLVATIVMVIVFAQMSGQSQWIPAALIGGWFIYTIWRRPAVAAFSAMSSAAIAGGPLILIAAPATVMLARRDMRLRIGERRSLLRTVKTLGLALLVFLLTLLFADAAVGRGSGSSGPESYSRGAQSVGDGSRSPLERFADWITRRDDVESTPGRFVRVPENAPTPPDESTPWWLLAIMAAGLALLAGLAYWFWRRRRATGGPSDPTVAAPLARLEMLGAAVGRPRRQHEGAISYAQELGTFTGDNRLAGTGTLVSGQVYASATTNAPAVEAGLVALEQAPPQAPPQPTRRERLTASVRRVVTVRGLAVGGLALAGVVAVVVVAASNSQALREPHLTNELAARMPRNTPSEWQDVLRLDDDEVSEWQACRGWGEEADGGTKSTSAVTGIAANDSRLGATLQVAHGNDRTPEFVTWSVGSDDSSSSWWDGNPGEPTNSRLQRDWYELDNYNDVPHHPFETVEETLVQLGVREPVRTEHVDSFGWAFSRFESRPLRYTDDQVVSGEILPAGIDGSFETMWALDIWTDSQDLPVRIRILGDEPDRSWSEWRRLPEAQPVRLATPVCPTTTDPNADEWAGYESWKPSRTVEPQIGLDDDGNPYDIYYWDDSFDQPKVEDAGDLDGPIAELGIGDIFTLVQEDPVAPIKVITDWSAGASIQSLSYAGGWPTGALVTADGAGPIVEWVSEADAGVYDTFVTLTTADNYPSLTSDELDPWLEPLWDGDLLTTIYFADQRTSPVTVLTLSDATKVVTGRDAQGQVAAVLIWDEAGPWRQLGLEGTPPSFVLEREAQLQECLAGTRSYDTTGRCSSE